jgi:hypothetical protein
MREAANHPWEQFLAQAMRAVRDGFDAVTPAIREAGSAFSHVARALQLTPPESHSILGYAIYVNGRPAGIVDRVSFNASGLTFTVRPRPIEPRWVADRGGILVPREFHAREEQLRRREAQDRWREMYMQQPEDTGAGQEFLRWVASRQGTSTEDSWDQIRRLAGRMLNNGHFVDRDRYEAFGENSYDDGSIRQEYIEGEIVDGAHTVTFTEEERLAVTAKPAGSIKREGRSRRVFEE